MSSNRGRSIRCIFFTSRNLREWTETSVLEGGSGNERFLYECPDCFELPVDGDAAKKKWVITAANSEYAIGEFDGDRFKVNTGPFHGVWGRGFYAAQTYNNAPDGRRLQIGWIQAEAPGMPFNQAQSLPSELTLRTTPEGPRLFRAPVKELESLRDGPDQSGALDQFRGELIEMRVDVKPGETHRAVLKVRGARIEYDPAKQELVVNGERAPALPWNGRQGLIAFVDRTLLEIYASGGLTYFTQPFVPSPDDQKVSIEAPEGGWKPESMQVYRLKSIWAD